LPSEAGLGKVSPRPYLKNRLKTEGLVVALVAGLMPSKHKVLSLIPSTAKMNKITKKAGDPESRPS
jgi:hypothetical protein